MYNELLNAELADIEQEAAAKTKALLDHQDIFIRAHELVALLKENGAPDDIHPRVVHSGSGAPGFIIYAQNSFFPHVVMEAIQDSRLPYRVEAGYNDAVRCVCVEGFEGVEIAMPAALLQSGMDTTNTRNEVTA